MTRGLRKSARFTASTHHGDKAVVSDSDGDHDEDAEEEEPHQHHDSDDSFNETFLVLDAKGGEE